MSTDKRRDWRELCEAVVKEQNPEHLMDLVSELMKALDERKGRAESPADLRSQGSTPFCSDSSCQ